MAKEVHVKLKADSEWQELEVANFYDPQKHHTVRFPNSTKKYHYAFMQMPDGRIYDKINESWVGKERSSITEHVDLASFEDLTDLPFGDESVKKITADMILQKKEKKYLVDTMRELYRVLEPMGRLEIAVPLYPHIDALSNPEYLTVFTIHTFNYFTNELFKSLKQTATQNTLNVVFYK